MIKKTQSFFDLKCDEVRDGLSAMLDGEVDAAEEAALRHHIETCVHCAAYYRSIRELDAQIRDHLAVECDETRLWEQVRKRIDSDPRAEVGRHRDPRPNWRYPVHRWAAAAVLVIGLALGSWEILRSGEESSSVLAATAQDFDKFLTSGEVLDVAANHPDAVLRWMTARVDFDLPARIDGPDGLKILGGRLCSFLDRKLAFFSFSLGADDVGLYITQPDGLDVPPNGNITAVARDDGLVAVTWYQGGLAYVAVSSLSIGELTELAEHFRDQEA